MLTLEQIKVRLADRNIREVARRTGLAYSTVLGYANGEITDPPHSIIVRLSTYLEGEPVAVPPPESVH